MTSISRPTKGDTMGQDVIEIVEIGPALSRDSMSEDEYASECEKLEACYTEVEGPGYSVEVRPCRAGEASGTYYREANGNLQILGYSVDKDDACPGLRDIQESAWKKYCKLP